jgi:hypothetical protein
MPTYPKLSLVENLQIKEVHRRMLGMKSGKVQLISGRESLARGRAELAKLAKKRHDYK